MAADGKAGTFRRLAELLALTAFVIAQPVLDVTGRAPDFFLYRRANTNEMRLFLVLVVLVPPLALWAVEVIVGLVSTVAARAVHLAFMALLFAVLVVEIGKKAGLFEGIPLAVLGVLAGGGLAVLLVRAQAFRQAVLYATPAPLVFALLFTMASPAGALVRGSEIGRQAGGSIAHRPPVVFLFLDEFPLRTLLDEKGDIDATLFPNFARLQQMSNWYPNATGVTGWTPYAAPAMLRGRYPEKPLAASYINYQETIFTLLAGTYDMRAYETVADLCPPGMCVGVSAGRQTGMRALTLDTLGLTGEIISPNKVKKNLTEQFVEKAVESAKAAAAGKDKPKAAALFGRVGLNQPERFGPFLDDLKPTARPNLHFMHLLLPHMPYRYLPSGKVHPLLPKRWPPDKADPKKPAGTTWDDPVLTALQKQRLLLQTVYTDSLIGAMLDRMKATGLLDEALLIVTADHGTGLEPVNKVRQLDDKNPPDLAWVPLFVKTPGQKAAKVDGRNTMQVDLLPTIADVLDVRIPWEVDGQSVLGPARTSMDKFWTDNPNGKGHHFTRDPWQEQLSHGYASEVIAKPGVQGLFSVGPLGGLVGKQVSEFTVGTPSPIVAKLHKKVGDLTAVDPETGEVPAAIYGDLDRPAGKAATWLVASVNGTIGGAIGAVPSNGDWRFLGIVDDSLFTKGAANVVLYEVDGRTLHPLRWEGK